MTAVRVAGLLLAGALGGVASLWIVSGAPGLSGDGASGARLDALRKEVERQGRLLAALNARAEAAPAPDLFRAAPSHGGGDLPLAEPFADPSDAEWEGLEADAGPREDPGSGPRPGRAPGSEGEAAWLARREQRRAELRKMQDRLRKELSDALGLSDAQRERVEAIARDAREAQRALRAQVSAGEVPVLEGARRLREIRDAQDRATQEVLYPDQREKLQELERNRRDIQRLTGMGGSFFDPAPSGRGPSGGRR